MVVYLSVHHLERDIRFQRQDTKQGVQGQGIISQQGVQGQGVIRTSVKPVNRILHIYKISELMS